MQSWTLIIIYVILDGHTLSKFYGLGLVGFPKKILVCCQISSFLLNLPIDKSITRLPLSPYFNAQNISFMNSLEVFPGSQNISYPLLQNRFQSLSPLFHSRQATLHLPPSVAHCRFNLNR